MRNKLTKFLTSECPPKGMRQFAKTWKYAACMLLAFILGIGQMWGADDVYYVMMYNSITEAGALTSSSSLSNGIVKYTSSTGKYASSTDITVTGMGSSKSSKYNNSSISNFTTVGNWAAGSGTAYAAGAKFTTLTIGLGTKHASSIKFIGYRNTSSTSDMTIGGTKKTTAKKPSNYSSDCLLEWTGDFTGDVSVSATGEHVGVFVITVPAGFSVTYVENGHGANQTDLTGQTKLPATLPTLSETGWIFGGWFTDEGLTEEAVAGATISKNTTLYAKWTEDDSVVKYSVTYDLNGPTGSAPMQEDVASGVSITLADAPSWAGHAFDGWLCSADAAVKAAGSSYTMTAAPTTFTAQWHELECKIYSFTGGIGSATAQTANATVDAEKMFVKDSGDKIRLTPATGESFKVGDILTFSGNLNNSAKKFGLKLYADGGSSVSQTIENAAGTVPMICSAALTFNADYIDIARADGTGTTIYTCEVHRACAEGVAAGLSYAETSVGKYSSDAAFTNPLTNANNLVVVYGSSDNGVATVNANGQVTLVGVGTATITAKSAVQTKAGTLYAAGTASYTLTVAAPPTFAVTYNNNGGDGTMTDSNSPYAEGAEVTLLDNTFTAPSGYAWSAWAVTETVSGNPVAVSEGKFTMPGVAVTVTAQWALIADFDVKFFQGYGDPDAQIGETQSISTGGHAVAPADPTRTGFAFLGWSYDATEAHIVDVATYGITAATNFTAMWKAVWTVTFDGAGNVNVEDGEAVASPNSPVTAGKVFQGWYNGESKYDFSATVAGNLALTSKWVDADANHYVYAYNDDFHFDGVVYKTPEGKVDNGDGNSNKAITTPYTLFSGAGGITSIVATGAIYDSKGTHVNAFLKLDTKASSYLTVTIASGYTAVMKVKMGSWNVGSAAPTVTFVDEDDTPVSYTGTMDGTAEGNSYAELTYNLSAGTYKMTTANKTLYFSNMDIQATALPTHTVTYKAGEGTGDDVVDNDATEVADVPGAFTAPTGKVFNGWKDESDNDVEVGAIVSADMTLTAQWINHYAVTFNMNGHGDAIDPQDIKEGAKATKPADPSESGWDFGGWFTDNVTFEASFDFNTPIVVATPLYAKWTADPCPSPFSLSKVVLTSASDGTVTGYNGNEYAGEAVIGGLKDDDNTAEVDPSHEGVEEGYKLNGGGSGIVFATLKKGNFQEGDRVIVTITAKQNSYKIEEVSQDVLHIYYGTNASDATKLTTLESVSTAGSYTYRLKAADITAIGTKKGIGVFRESSNGQNPYVYSVEIKGCRSFAEMHTLTFKNFDGTATIAAEPLEEGAYASTVAPTAPKITLKRFIGWSEDMNGTPVELTSYTITEDKILYAVYEDIVCPTSGTVYKFEIKDELPSENLPTSTDKDMSSYITATGDGYLTYTATANNKATINSDGTIQLKDQTAAYLKVELECALAAGDQIRAHVTNNPIRVQVGTTYDSNKDLILAKNAYEFVAITSAMEGKQILYITRSSNGNANLADFEIYRPAKYDVSFNMMGHGSAIADLEDVVDGSKIAAPSPAPTDVDYSFAGWYKENTLENEWDFDVDVVDDNITLYAKWLDKSDATLKSLKYGETEITLEAGVYTYNVSLPAFTSAVPALTAETSSPNATKVITNGTFDGEGNATSTVTVTPEVGADQIYTVNFAKGVEIMLQDVTGSTTWNFANAVTETVNITGTPHVLANYGGVTNDATFESNKLEASGEKFTAGTKANLRANYIHFHTTVQGMLTISYSNTGGSNPARFIYVNGVKYDEEGSANTTAKGADRKVFVPAGDVELVMKDGEGASKNVQIYQIIFKAPDYVRTEMLGNGVYGTICVDHNVPEGGVRGVTVYEIAGREPQYGKIAFDEVTEMEAGVPYVFIAHGNEMALYYGETKVDNPVNGNGMYGTFIAQTLTDLDGIYYFAKSALWSCVDLTSLNLPANRAYVKLSEIDYLSDPNPAPGRKRILLGVNGQNAATDVDLLNAAEAPVKMLINGQLFILRGEKMYDATGRMVK